MVKKHYNQLLERVAEGKKSFAILIDPDKAGEIHLATVIAQAAKHQVDYFFVGGSLITTKSFNDTISFIKKHSAIPVIIFPGNSLHLDENADALLFLSLISGRNPEFLIGQQVVAAPRLKGTSLEVLPTGYILVDGGKPTTVSYISNTTPIPADKPEIVAATALAGELMGLKLIYLDSGSGALFPVSTLTLQTVRKWISTPIIVGGGIDTPEKAKACWDAGADIVVVGNAIEKDVKLIEKFAGVKQKANK